MIYQILPTSCPNDIIPQGPTIYTSPILIKGSKITNLNNNCVQFESEFDKMFKKIINQASKSGISLKIFNKITVRYQNSQVEREAFIGASLILNNLIKKRKYPRYIRSTVHYQQLISGKYYLKKGASGFEKLARQTDIIYGGIIYILRCRLRLSGIFANIELIYIGRTWKTKKQRFIDHVWDAINTYVEKCGVNSRYIEKLIILAIKYVIRENPEIYSEIPSLDLMFKRDDYRRDNCYVRNVINKIADLLFHEYFTMEIAEVHKNYETTSKREVFWIRNFPRTVNGKSVEGTLYPKGLNMIDHETKNDTLSLPLYDMVFAISLGFNGPEINKFLYDLYKIDIDYTQIYIKIRKFFKNWDHCLGLFFKPNIQRLLEYSFDWRDIAITLRKHPSYRGKTNFQKWFLGLNISQLKFVIKQDNFSWEKLGKIASHIFDENKIRGISRDVWIEWFIINKGMPAIADETGYKNAAAFNASWIKQDRESKFQKAFAPSYSAAVRKYRKIKAIQLLTDEDFVDTSLSSRLYWIYVNVFKLTRWEDLKVPRPSQGLRNCRAFFNNLFEKKGLTYEHLESLDASDSKLLNNLL